MLSKKFIIGGAILFVSLTLLSYIVFVKSDPYYYSVSELVGQSTSVFGENVRVSGIVVPGSAEVHGDGPTIRFKLTDGKESLSVVYRGVAPATFGEGAEVVVEGRYDHQSLFEAINILTKCPSKYTERKPEP